jgi:hypothetical protein
MENKIQAFKKAGGAYSYYLGDDLKCKDKDIIDNIRNRIGIKKGMVGVKKGIKCYSNDDIFIYHYPLMRRKIGLGEMLKDQVKEVSKVQSQGQNMYIFVQTHPQFWYQEIINQGGADKKALLYPDGQTTRMLVHYAVATGAHGYFLYNNRSLSGDESRERSIGSAQAILETRGLYDAILKAQGIDFFKKGNDIYGTVIKGPSYDIIFAFSSDVKTYYHPTAKPIQIDLKDLIQTKKYKSVHQYFPYGSSPAGNKVDVPQDHALILIALKDNGNISSLELDSGGLKLYSDLLKARSERLAQNMKAMGASVPEFKENAKNMKDQIVSLLAYIDSLNEMKRDIWWKKAGKLSTDGDTFNALYWKKEPIKPAKGDIFNFYYMEAKQK